MKTIDIKQNDAGQRLDKFLTKAYPNLPQSLLYRSIRLKRIKLNGKRAEISTRLKPGDVLGSCISTTICFSPLRSIMIFFTPPKS